VNARRKSKEQWRQYAITLEITVIDEERLRKAALDNAIQDGETSGVAEERLQTVPDYIQQVFDPGLSPPGTEIENCEVELLR